MSHLGHFRLFDPFSHSSSSVSVRFAPKAEVRRASAASSSFEMMSPGAPGGKSLSDAARRAGVSGICRAAELRVAAVNKSKPPRQPASSQQVETARLETRPPGRMIRRSPNSPAPTVGTLPSAAHTSRRETLCSLGFSGVLFALRTSRRQVPRHLGRCCDLTQPFVHCLCTLATITRPTQ